MSTDEHLLLQDLLDLPQVQFDKLIELAKQLKAVSAEDPDAATSLDEPPQAA